MCYHTSTPSSDELKEYLESNKIKDYHLEDDFQPFYHIDSFKRPFLPTTLSESPDKISLTKWHFVPNGNDKYELSNATCEKLLTHFFYKNDALVHRGLLWINGFYEPHEDPDVKGSENYFCYQENFTPFTLAIIYTKMIDPITNKKFNGFSVITTPANEQFREIHNKKERMPLIIEERQREFWLKTTNPEEIKMLMQPYAYELLAHQTVRVTGMKGRKTNYSEIRKSIGKIWVRGKGIVTPNANTLF